MMMRNSELSSVLLDAYNQKIKDLEDERKTSLRLRNRMFGHEVDPDEDEGGINANNNEHTTAEDSRVSPPVVDESSSSGTPQRRVRRRRGCD